MAIGTDDFLVDIEWSPAEEVKTPELRATFARFALRVRDSWITEVEDTRSTSLRRHLNIPLYPLAEWIAFNWWHLISENRPSALNPFDWTYRSKQRLGPTRTAWLERHNMRAVGDGYRWPDLTIIPGTEMAAVSWLRDPSPRLNSHIRFVSSGREQVAIESVVHVLSSLVELVLERLEAAGISGSPLANEWGAIVSLDDDQREFCRAAARLGLDPFSISEKETNLIIDGAQMLNGDLLDDFLDSASPTLLKEDLEWLDTVFEAFKGSPMPENEIPAFHLAPLPVGKAWTAGLRDAHSFRSAAGISDAKSVDPEQWLAVSIDSSPDRAIEGVGQSNSQRRSALVLAYHRSEESRRFAMARALWRSCRQPLGSGFLLTRSRQPAQQAERAFAAEFLAPAAGIQALMASDDETVYPDEVSDVSKRFGVNEWVIKYQLINQLGREVYDDVGVIV